MVNSRAIAAGIPVLQGGEDVNSTVQQPEDGRSNVLPFQATVKNGRRQPARFSADRIIAGASMLLMLLPMAICMVIVLVLLCALAIYFLSGVNTFFFILALHAIAVSGGLIWRKFTQTKSTEKICDCLGPCAMNSSSRW